MILLHEMLYKTELADERKAVHGGLARLARQGAQHTPVSILNSK